MNKLEELFHTKEQIEKELAKEEQKASEKERAELERIAQQVNEKKENKLAKSVMGLMQQTIADLKYIINNEELANDPNLPLYIFLIPHIWGQNGMMGLDEIQNKLKLLDTYFTYKKKGKYDEA